ncbi:hypothetical protein OBBRIDRAFT_662689 [Obba rivulosa]|uniref:Uncharacterized protein n=1 Tax=Obba rivulosa TaxID=1052685 RepID=A0A8E2ARC2_9APHY|nr:hypothetical protein OBBRIDRAFT_662689 [Obba rivulosa]
MCADASEVGDIVETVRSSAKAVVPVASLCLQPSKAPTALSQDTLDSYSVALVSTPTSCSLADNRPNGAQSVDSLNPAAVGSGSSLGPSTSHIEAREATLNDASETRATAMSQSPQMGVPAEDREREPKDQPEGPAEQATKRSRRIGRAGQKRRKEKNRERAEQYRQRVGKEPIGQGCSDAIGDKSGTVGSAMSITAADETVISVKNVEDGLAIASASASVAVIEAASARKDISKENNNAKADAGPKARKPDSPSEYTSFSAEYEQSMGSGHPFIDPFVEPSDTSSSITANPPNDNSRPVSSGAFFSSLSVTARSASPENRWRAFLRSQHLDEAAINDIPAQVSDSSYVEDDMDEDADSYEQLEWISQASYSSNIKSDHFGQSYRTGQHMQRTANVYPPEHGYDVGLADPWPPRGHHVQTPTARTGISQQYRDDYETTSWIERWMSSEDFPGTAGPSLAGPLHGYRPPYSELEQSRSQDDDAHDEADHLPGPESRADGARWRNRKNNKWRDVRRYKKRPQNALNSASLNPAAQPTLATPQPTADVPYLMEDPGASLGWNWNGNEKEKARQQ